MIKFYKEAATRNWVCGVKRKIVAGTCTMETNADNSYIEIKENGLDKTIAEGPVSSFVDETGTPYLSFEALDSATKDFFVKASGSNTELEARVDELENKQSLFIDYWTIESADALGNKRNNNGIIEEYNGSAWVVVTIAQGDTWFDSVAVNLAAYSNGIWIVIPLSTDSVYVDRTTNQQYAWSGSTMTSMAVPLTKASIEDVLVGEVNSHTHIEKNYSADRFFLNGKLSLVDTRIETVYSESYILDFAGLGQPDRFRLINFGTDLIVIGFLNVNLLTNLEDIGTTPAFVLNYNYLDDILINALFSELPETNKVATINVCYNPGSATCTPTIATAKGYIVRT